MYSNDKGFNDFLRYFVKVAELKSFLYRLEMSVEDFPGGVWSCSFATVLALYQQCPYSDVLVAEARSCINATQLNCLGIMLKDINYSLQPWYDMELIFLVVRLRCTPFVFKTLDIANHMEKLKEMPSLLNWIKSKGLGSKSILLNLNLSETSLCDEKLIVRRWSKFLYGQFNFIQCAWPVV